MQKSFIIIAIDGGAAAGKSSTSRALAAHYNFLHVDTGMHYRGITWSLLEGGVDLNNQTAIGDFLKSSIHIKTRIEQNSTFIQLNGCIPTSECLRSTLINTHVSQIASLPDIRCFLLKYQRSLADLAKKNNYPGIIMEGRDIGSVIFPEADFKFFLDAHAQTRASRRALETTGQDSIFQRDAVDSSRKVSPLVCPPDAILIDSSYLTLQQVIDKMCFTINTKFCAVKDL